MGAAGGMSGGLGELWLQSLMGKQKKEVKKFDPETVHHYAEVGDAAAVKRLLADHPDQVNLLFIRDHTQSVDL